MYTETQRGCTSKGYSVMFTRKEPCPLYRVFLYNFEIFCCIRLSASGWSLVQRSPTECGVSS